MPPLPLAMLAGEDEADERARRFDSAGMCSFVRCAHSKNSLNVPRRSGAYHHGRALRALGVWTGIRCLPDGKQGSISGTDAS